MAESKEERVAKSWQNFLKPVAEGLVALMAGASLWLNSSNNETCELRYADVDKRTVVLESQVKDLQNNQNKLSDKIDKILDAVQSIQIDMAKISTVIDNTTVKRK